MAPPSPSPPAPTSDLHARLLAGDRSASLDVVETYLPILVARLRRRWPAISGELCEDAALEALFNYLRAPDIYNPSRSQLGTYLFHSAHRDLQNILAREARQRSPGAYSLDRVELGPEGRKEWLGARRVASPEPAEDGPMEVDPALTAAIAAALPDERDRRALALMADGERATSTFAAVLGLDDLPIEERQRAVKRAKDRIQKRVRRYLERRQHE